MSARGVKLTTSAGPFEDAEHGTEEGKKGSNVGAIAGGVVSASWSMPSRGRQIIS